MKNNQGIALITVLVFLQVLTLLGLCAIEMALVETKQGQALWQKHLIKNSADQILQEIEHEFRSALPVCKIPVTSSAELSSYPIEWWKNLPACSGRLPSTQYYYVVEFLGSDPCAFIQILPKKIIANYFRISLLTITGKSKFLFQTTYVTPNEEAESMNCLGVSHQVRAGRQMWRF